MIREQVQYIVQQPTSVGKWTLARPDRDLGYPVTFFDTEPPAREALAAYRGKYPSIRFRLIRRKTTTTEQVLHGAS